MCCLEKQGIGGDDVSLKGENIVVGSIKTHKSVGERLFPKGQGGQGGRQYIESNIYGLLHVERVHDEFQLSGCRNLFTDAF